MSHLFVVYDKTTGRITSSGLCQPGMLPYLAKEGHDVVETDQHVEPNEYRVDLDTFSLVPVGDGHGQ